MRRLILDPPNAEPPWRYLKWQDACTAIRTADEQHGPDSKEAKQARKREREAFMLMSVGAPADQWH